MDIPGTVLLLLSLSLLIGSATPAAAQGEADLVAIEQAWQARQEKARTAEFRWTEVIASYEHIAPCPIQPQGGQFISLQEKVHTLALDEDRVRYTCFHEVLLDPDKLDRMSFEACVFDGKTIKKYIPPGLNIFNAQGQAQVRVDDEHPHVKEISLQPLMLTYRGLTPKMCDFPLSVLKLLPQRESFAGRECLVLSDQRVIERYARTIWVDPARSYAVVRILGKYEFKDGFEVDITHVYDPQYGWIPDGWVHSEWNPTGKLRARRTGKIDHFKLNIPIDAAAFDIQFPGGVGIEPRQ